MKLKMEYENDENDENDDPNLDPTEASVQDHKHPAIMQPTFCFEAIIYLFWI